MKEGINMLYMNQINNSFNYFSAINLTFKEVIYG